MRPQQNSAQGSDWVRDAACGDADPVLFDDAPTAAGIKYCARCRVRSDCVADAIRNHARGAWGGLTDRQRSALARRGWTTGQPLPPLQQPRQKAAARPVAQLSLTDEQQQRRPAAPRPRPDQQQALRDIAAGLSGSPRGQVLRACGTGKTLIGRWAAEQQNAETTAVFVPSLQLVAQTLIEWRRPGGWPFAALVVCSDATTAAGIAERSDGDQSATSAAWHTSRVPVTTDPAEVARFLSAPGRKVLFSTYHSAPVVAAALRAGARLDLAVLDEGHHLAGRPSSNFRATLDDTQILASRRLVMTATPVLDADTAGRLRPGGNTRPGLSMNDAQAFGPVLHRLSFGDAIEQGLLCDYRVLVVGVRAPAGPTTRPGQLPLDATLNALRDAVNRFGVRRVLSFHTRVAAAAGFARQATAATGGWPPDHRVWAAAISSATPAGRRRMLLARLGAAGGDTVGIVASARCLGEGTDVPGVDGVLFADPRRSLIDIVQAVGRVLRPAPGKDIGTIIIPVALPADGDDEEALLDSPFAHVWTVLRALRAHDERLAAELDTLSRLDGSGRLQPGGDAGLPGRIHFVLPGNLAMPAVRLRMIRQTGSRWERMFGLLEAFTAVHGHARVPSTAIAEDEKLGAWVTQQRSRYRRRLLGQDRVQRLAALPGWRWTAAETETDRMVERLTAHITSLGSAKQPPHGPSIYACTRGARHRTLGVWAAALRQQQRHGILAEDIATRLQSLPDWDWRPIPDSDLAMVDVLAAFTGREGHGNPPPGHLEPLTGLPAGDGQASTDSLPLGQWVREVRRRALLGRLHPALEEEILAATPALSSTVRRFAWDVHETRWLLGLDALFQYASREHHTVVPDSHIEEVDGAAFDLGSWCTAQRQLHHRAALSSDRAALLRAQPHWTWDPGSATTAARQRARAADAAPCAPAAAHGTPARYDLGCRCRPCIAAHQPYEQAAQLAASAQAEQAPGELLPASRARRLLRDLDRHGVTPSQSARASGIDARRLEHIAKGLVAQISPAEDAAIAGAAAAAIGPRRRRQESDEQQRQWQRRLDLMSAWISAHPDERVPPELTMDSIQIGRWAGEQRLQWRRGRILAARAALLQSLPGWAWDPGQTDWDTAVARLEAFARESGHAEVAENCQSPDGFYLGAWVRKQRSQRAAGHLLPARAAKLSAIPGWKWHAGHDAAFEAGIAALSRFAGTHGHACPVATFVDPDGFKLGRWVVNLRHRRSALTPAKAGLLEAVPGWDWDPFETRWQASYSQLSDYAARTGTADVADSYDEAAAAEGPPLGRWVAQQRSDHSRRSLAPHRRQLLEALPGWTWDGHEARRRRAVRRRAGQENRTAVVASGAGPVRCPFCQYLVSSAGHELSCTPAAHISPAGPAPRSQSRISS